MEMFFILNLYMQNMCSVYIFIKALLRHGYKSMNTTDIFYKIKNM